MSIPAVNLAPDFSTYTTAQLVTVLREAVGYQRELAELEGQVAHSDFQRRITAGITAGLLEAAANRLEASP